MKKLITLVLAAGLVVSSFTGASAGDFKPSATLINSYEFGDAGANTSNRYNKFGVDDHFMASLRMDLGFDYIASENLSATFLMRFQEAYGSIDATNGGHGTMFDSSMNGSLGVRLAYLDWKVPSTDVLVRLGYQPAVLPSFAFGSAVIDTRGGGVTIVAPINENISLATFWVRAITDGDQDTNVDVRGHDDLDVAGFVFDFNYDGFRITPWAVYMMSGSEAGYAVGSYNNSALLGFNAEDTTGYWIGASFELSMFDPFTFALDAFYNDIDYGNGAKYGNNAANQIGKGEDLDSTGAYFVAASASYKTDMGVPALKGWYASGNNEKSNGEFENGAPMTISGNFNATSIMFEDQVIDNGLGNVSGGSPAGTWGIVLEWADMSFIEKLNHTARVAYIGGTNDLRSTTESTLYMMDKDDSVIELNFNSTYEIYKNLSTSLEIGYLFVDFDKHQANDDDKDVFRTALSFSYSF